MTRAATAISGMLLILGSLLSPLAIPAQAADAAAPTTDAKQDEDPWAGLDMQPGTGSDVHAIDRGPGWYVSLFKVILAWLLILLWIWTTDWINRDCQSYGMNYVVWNAVAVFPFFLAVLLMWEIPYFIVGFLLMILAYGASVGSYVFYRNQEVEPHERVLTPEHFRHILATKGAKVGVKIDKTKKAAHELGAPVEFTPEGGATDRDNSANLLLARQSPGFVPAKDLIAEAVGARSEVVMLDYASEGVAVRHQIDGVWHAAAPRDRATGDPLLAVYKTLAALDPQQRAARQAGTFRAALNGRKFSCRLMSQGTETGERVVLKLEDLAAGKQQLADLGMRDKIIEQFLALTDDAGGFVLLSAMPAGGLSTTLQSTLQECDRLMRSFVEFEDARQKEIDLENVEVKTYDAAAGQTPLTVLPEVLRSYPEVLVVPQIADAQTVSQLCAQATDENREVIGTIRAKEAAEALLRVLMLKVPAAEFAPAVKCVLNQRLIRKLCETCRVAYEPTPDLLQKLGIPAGRIAALYREPTAEEVQLQQKKTCPTCAGIGYFGRTSLFELLVVDAKIREVLLKQPKLDLLKKVARAAGMRSLQDEAILLVAKGVTSVNEMLRVLKQ